MQGLTLTVQFHSGYRNEVKLIASVSRLAIADSHEYLLSLNLNLIEVECARDRHFVHIVDDAFYVNHEQQ